MTWSEIATRSCCGLLLWISPPANATASDFCKAFRKSFWPTYQVFANTSKRTGCICRNRAASRLKTEFTVTKLIFGGQEPRSQCTGRARERSHENSARYSVLLAWRSGTNPHLYGSRCLRPVLAGRNCALCVVCSRGPVRTAPRALAIRRHRAGTHDRYSFMPLVGGVDFCARA